MNSHMSLTDDTVAFPTLDDAELAVLETLGTRRSVTVGEYLYREGDTTYDFYVIRSGTAEIVLHSDGDELSAGSSPTPAALGAIGWPHRS